MYVIMVGLPWGQLKGLSQHLKSSIKLLASSIVIEVLALIDALQAKVAAKWSLNLSREKFFSLLITASIIRLIVSLILFFIHVGWAFIIIELTPKS